MQKVNLEKFSFAELVAIRNQIYGLLQAKKVQERALLRDELAAMAKSQGFDVSDIIGGRSKAPIKYRDPENPANTWTGRGRTPRWMVAATKKRGVTREDFLV